jgi:arylformamidase
MSQRRSSSRWRDVSMPIRSNMLRWPGDPAVRVEPLRDLEHDAWTVSALSLGTHSGTHLDAPRHASPTGAAIDEMPVEVAVGTARVIGVQNPRAITAEELAQHGIRPGERLLMRTANSNRALLTRRFVKHFVALTPGAAEFLAARRIRLIGIDYLSVSAFGATAHAVHRRLLDAGIWILEGLDLTLVRPGNYELICLPLRIAGAAGAPARALLRRRPSRQPRVV